MGETRLLQNARRRHRSTLRTIADELRSLREDAGLSQASVARAANLSQSFLSEIEAGRCQPTLETLHVIAAVLGHDVSLRLFPNEGPAIRDRFQARMVEALLRILDPRWTVRLEVPVRGTIRGVIDLVLTDPVARLDIATEVHSDLRRVERQLRWAHMKADAFAATGRSVPADEHAGRLDAERRDAEPRSAEPPDGGRRTADPRGAVSRLVVLRSTRRTRSLAAEFAATFAAEVPGDPGIALAALTTGTAPWPGPSLLWANVHGTRVTIFAARPGNRRGLRPRTLVPERRSVRPLVP